MHRQQFAVGVVEHRGGQTIATVRHRRSRGRSTPSDPPPPPVKPRPWCVKADMPPSTPLPPVSRPPPDIVRSEPSPDRHQFVEHVGKPVVYTPPSANTAAWYHKPIHKQGLGRWGWRRLQRCKSGLTDKPTHLVHSEDRPQYQMSSNHLVHSGWCHKQDFRNWGKISSGHNSTCCHKPNCRSGFRNWEWQKLKVVHKTCSLMEAHWRIINTRVRPVLFLFFCLYMWLHVIHDNGCVLFLIILYDSIVCTLHTGHLRLVCRIRMPHCGRYPMPRNCSSGRLAVIRRCHLTVSTFARKCYKPRLVLSQGN